MKDMEGKRKAMYTLLVSFKKKPGDNSKVLLGSKIRLESPNEKVAL